MCYIPFTTYLSYSAVILAAYYLLIVSVYYRKQILARLKGPREERVDLSEEDSVLFNMASSLHALIAQAAAQKSDKAEALHFVRQFLHKYESAFNASYCEKLQPLIVADFERKLKVQLSEAEIHSLWPAMSS